MRSLSCLLLLSLVLTLLSCSKSDTSNVLPAPVLTGVVDPSVNVPSIVYKGDFVTMTGFNFDGGAVAFNYLTIANTNGDPTKVYIVPLSSAGSSFLQCTIPDSAFQVNPPIPPPPATPPPPKVVSIDTAGVYLFTINVHNLLSTLATPIKIKRKAP